MSQTAILALGNGAAFGAALVASGVHLPSIILDQFNLTDFHMMKVFMVALGSSASVMFAMERVGLLSRPVRPNVSLGIFSDFDGNIIGGSLVGIGMALSGACPGTVIVQLAQGIYSAQWTALGALGGAGLYIRIKDSLLRQRCAGDSVPESKATKVTEAFRISNVLTYSLLGLAVAAILLVPTSATNKITTPPLVGGALIGVAQAISLLFRHQPLGVSTAYEQIAQYAWRACGMVGVKKPPKVPEALIFSMGIFAGALVLSLTQPQLLYKSAQVHIPNWQALVSGVAMVFGARLAGGCTSGHGISGLGALSVSSLYTVASMFGAGIGLRLLMASF